MAVMVKEARLEAIWFNKEITILLRGKLSTRPFSADRVPSIHLHPAKHLHYLHNGARNDSVFKRLPDLFVQCRAYRCFGSVVGDRTIPPEHSRGCCLPTKHSRKVRAAPALNRWCSRWGIHCFRAIWNSAAQASVLMTLATQADFVYLWHKQNFPCDGAGGDSKGFVDVLWLKLLERRSPSSARLNIFLMRLFSFPCY